MHRLSLSLVWGLFFLPFGVGAAPSVAGAPEAESVAVMAEWPERTEVSEINGGTIHFRVAPFIGPLRENVQRSETLPTPKSVKTSLHKLEFLGFLEPDESKTPYLVLSGQECADCDRRRFVYLIRGDGSSQTKYTYPGKIFNRRTGRKVMDARAFFGTCLHGRGDVLVTFQRDKMRRRRYLQPSVLVAEAGPKKVTEKLLIRRRQRPGIRHTLRRVKKKICTEIKGFDRRTVARRAMELEAQKLQEVEESSAGSTENQKK